MIQVLVGSEIIVGAVRLHHPELAVIEIERPVVPHGAQVADLDDADRFNGIQVLREDILLGELYRKLGELQQFLGRGEHLPAVGFGEGLAHPARHGEGGMDGPTRQTPPASGPPDGACGLPSWQCPGRPGGCPPRSAPNSRRRDR